LQLKSIELDMRGAPVAVRAQMNEILPEMRQALSRKRALVERTREKSQRENLSLDRVRPIPTQDISQNPPSRFWYRNLLSFF
jgi:hypothetical protein